MSECYIWNSSGITSCPRPIDRAEVLPDEDEEEDDIDDFLED